MPIASSSARQTFLALRVSRNFNGPKPTCGSLPRKKFLQTDISGTVARSWKTVAIPAPSASRGEVNDVASPLTRNSPSVGWCTPLRILIRVDLPAPLSPSTQVTVPGSTCSEMSRSAITLPKLLPTFFSWSAGVTSDGGRRQVGLRDLVEGRHFFAPAARLLMKVLTRTAAKRITPRNSQVQSVFQPAYAMPMKAMPMIDAPMLAPSAEP